MSPADARNRRRWVVGQRAQARATTAASLEAERMTQDQELAQLRQMAEMMRAMPQMASTLAEVEARIRRMEA